MTDSQTDGRTLAARYLKGLNDHDPDAADGYLAVNYINPVSYTHLTLPTILLV